MTERDPLIHDPWAPSLPNELGRLLAERTGLDWSAWHKGDVSSVPDTAVLAGFREDEHGRAVLAGIVLLGDAITGEMLRKVPISALENGRNLGMKSADEALRDELAKLTPLAGADRSDPEAFARLVAEHYKAWARAVPHPVAAMAAEAKVKPPTVHTWVREARLRGFLPPARRGKG